MEIDLKTGDDSRHEYSFDSYHDENVYRIDPYNTFEGPKPFKKEEFFEKLNHIVITDMEGVDIEHPEVFIGKNYIINGIYS